MLPNRFRQLPELAILAATILFGLVFFSLTDPKTLPPALLIVGFIILMVGIYCVLRLLAKALGLRGRLKSFQYHSLLIGGTLLPVMLLALQSIGQLMPRDILTLVILFAAGYFYLSRMYGQS
jgi:hypothetical protein